MDSGMAVHAASIEDKAGTRIVRAGWVPGLDVALLAQPEEACPTTLILMSPGSLSLEGDALADCNDISTSTGWEPERLVRFLFSNPRAK